MSVISRPQEFNVGDLYVDLRWSLGVPLHLKCEGFNFAGSVKLKAAAEIVASAERKGAIGPGTTLVESSSGNMGVALSLVAADRGYRFTCVTDSRCTLAARQLMQTLGSDVHVITKPHPTEGLLGARLRHVRRLCAENDKYVWLNQYHNPGNWMAHYRSTAPGDPQRVPADRRAVRRRRHHGHADGLRALPARGQAVGADRGRRRRGLRHVRRTAAPPA